MRIRKIFVYGIIVIFLILFLVPSRLLNPSIRGSFNHLTGIYFCEGEQACKHEEGHFQDSLCAPKVFVIWKYCNKDPEFRKLVGAIQGYDVAVYVDGPQIASWIFTFPGFGENPRKFRLDGWTLLQGGWGGYGELYASLYKWKSDEISIIQFLEEILLELQKVHAGE